MLLSVIEESIRIKNIGKYCFHRCESLCEIVFESDPKKFLAIARASGFMKLMKKRF
jgi:hypothetical protein